MPNFAKKAKNTLCRYPQIIAGAGATHALASFSQKIMAHVFAFMASQKIFLSHFVTSQLLAQIILRRVFRMVCGIDGGRGCVSITKTYYYNK